MKNPMFDRQHLKEYFLYGSIAALLYMVPVIYFLYNHKYENLYYLYIGCFLFMVSIFYYNYKLLDRQFDRKRAVSMLISGHLAVLAGIILACLFVIVSMLFAFPDLFSNMPPEQVIPNANDTNKIGNPGYLLLMILSTATIGNFGTGSFISLLITYAGKRDQTKDKPTNLEVRIPRQR